jgi:putative PIN family toxin of toxin-antitoxin system
LSAAGRLIARLLEEDGGDVVVSAEILLELAAVLGRAKFATRLATDKRYLFLLRLTALAMLVEPAESVTECRDPSDNIVLETALELSHYPSEITVIVSDDQDLLAMDPWRGIRIMKPEAALALLQDNQQ